MNPDEQVKLLKASKLFDQKWYVETYPEVGLLGMDPALHYFRYGAAMMRNPSKEFDTGFYLGTSSEAESSGLNSLVHYLLHGRDDGHQQRITASRELPEVEKIGQRLWRRGFGARALVDLSSIARSGETAEARAEAALTLAQWHLEQNTLDHAQEVLAGIAAHREGVLPIAMRSRLALVELIALFRLGNAEAAAKAYERWALMGAVTPDVLLANANFQDQAALRLVLMNQVFAVSNLSPGMLDEQSGATPLGCLTAVATVSDDQDGALVSVIIDGRAGGSAFLTTLRSLAGQSWQRLEIFVLVNAAAPNALKEQAEVLAQSEGRLRVLPLPAGEAAAAVLEQAKGVYALWLDIPAWLHPSLIETQVRVLEEAPQVAACSVQSVLCGEDLRFTTLHRNGRLIADDPRLLMWRREGLEIDAEERFTGGSLAIQCIQQLGEAALSRHETGPLALVVSTTPDRAIVPPAFADAPAASFDIAVIGDLRPGSDEVEKILSIISYARKEEKSTVLANVWYPGADLGPDAVDIRLRNAIGQSGGIMIADAEVPIAASLTLVSKCRLLITAQNDTACYMGVPSRIELPEHVESLDAFICSTEFKLKTGNRGARSAPIHAVASLRKWLWGGFSEAAREQLENVIKSDSYTKTDRSAAAYSLARWYAHLEQWAEVHRVLTVLSKIDVQAYRNKKCKLLLVEAFIKLEQYDKGKTVVDFVLNDRVDGDFCCARNNLLLAEMPNDWRQQRIDAINGVFLDAGLLPISFAEDEDRIRFGHWTCEPKPEHMVDGPKVSVLMPVYKAGEFIEIAVRSILSQTWRNIEIIAVEDCGPDDSWEKLQALAESDSRLRIFRNDRNLGAYPTRNRALSFATGDFITVHDSDDWSHPQMIEMQMSAMHDNPGLKATFSRMTRVYDDLRFMLRPQRENLEYVHRSYPSLLIRRSDVEVLGEWDSVSANADDEFVQRIRMTWGPESLEDILPNVPLSYFLVHEESLTQQKGTSLNSLTFGIRQDYVRQANYWRSKMKAKGEAIRYTRKSLKDPFPIPAGLAPKHWERDTRYDIVLVSDLSLLGGTRRCNEGYIRAATALGLRVGLFHWPRFDLRPMDIASEYMELSYHPLVDFVVPEDQITAGLVLIHHPPILKYRIDAVPGIRADRVAILVNQSPMQLFNEAPHYYDGPQSEALCRELFGVDPIWLSIAPRVTGILESVGGFSAISEEIWYPPYSSDLPDLMPPLPEGLGSDRTVVLGRHARDHWTKWPEKPEALSQAYCAGVEGIAVRLLGGTGTPMKTLGALPSNWEDIAFDSIPVDDFVRGLDFFTHFVHSDYIEEFGRNIMEAMAAGRVVILPYDFRDTFGDSAIYCLPHEVADTVRRLWMQPEVYMAQAQRGFDFVQQHCTLLRLQERLKGMVHPWKQ